MSPFFSAGCGMVRYFMAGWRDWLPPVIGPIYINGTFFMDISVNSLHPIPCTRAHSLIYVRLWSVSDNIFSCVQAWLFRVTAACRLICMGYGTSEASNFRHFPYFIAMKHLFGNPSGWSLRFIKIHIFRENKEYFPSLSQLAAKKLRNRAVESMKTLQTDWQHENGIWSKQDWRVEREKFKGPRVLV